MEQIVITGIFSFPTGEAASARIRQYSLGFKRLNYQPWIISMNGHSTGDKLEVKGQTFFKTFDDILFYPICKLSTKEFKLISRIYTTLIYPFLITWLGLKASLFAKRIGAGIIFVYGRSFLLSFVIYMFKRCFYKEVKIITDITEPPFDYHRQALLDPYNLQNILKVSMRFKLLDSILFFRGLQLFDLVIFITSELENVYGKNLKKKIVVPSIVYLSDRKEIERKFQPLITRPKLLYLGSFFDKDYPEIMFPLLASIKENFEDFEIRLAGKLNNNASKYWVSKYADYFGDHLKVFNSPHYGHLKKIISESDFMICLRQETSLQKFTFPTRIVESLENRLPVVTNAYGDIPMYFTNGENVIFVDIESCCSKNYFSELLAKYLCGSRYDSLLRFSEEILHSKFSAEYYIKLIIQKIE